MRDRNESAWSRVLPHFAAACTTIEERSAR